MYDISVMANTIKAGLIWVHFTDESKTAIYMLRGIIYPVHDQALLKLIDEVRSGSTEKVKPIRDMLLAKYENMLKYEHPREGQFTFYNRNQRIRLNKGGRIGGLVDIKLCDEIVESIKYNGPIETIRLTIATSIGATLDMPVDSI
jgi:hypothetical protein